MDVDEQTDFAARVIISAARTILEHCPAYKPELGAMLFQYVIMGEDKEKPPTRLRLLCMVSRNI